MTTRSHTHEVILPVSPDAAFRLLHTPSAIRVWWQAARAIVQPQSGGIWAAAWGDDEDDPDYVGVATLRVFDPPRRLVMGDYRYFAKTGPLPFQADFEVEFNVEPHADGARLSVEQRGFPAEATADAFYAACEKGWHDTLNNIRQFVGG